MLNFIFVFLVIVQLYTISKTIDMFLQKHPRILIVSAAFSVLVGAFCIVVFVANVLPVSGNLDDFYPVATILYVVSILFSLVFISIADIYARLFAQQPKN
jgi:hypothetical protein